MKKIPLEYFRNKDVLTLSKDLIGKFLMTCIDGVITGGMIVETEAYRGPEDKASHAFGGCRTNRNNIMYSPGGVGYVYKCYGIHHMFNIVTNDADIPHAILIRGIRPTDGIEHMLQRRKKKSVNKTLAGGPGTLCQALGISMEHNGIALTGDVIWLEDRDVFFSDEIKSGPRIGIDYAAEHALLPWRFFL